MGQIGAKKKHDLKKEADLDRIEHKPGDPADNSASN